MREWMSSDPWLSLADLSVDNRQCVEIQAQSDKRGADGLSVISHPPEAACHVVQESGPTPGKVEGPTPHGGFVDSLNTRRTRAP